MTWELAGLEEECESESETEKWLEYERRKAELVGVGLTPAEYHRAVNRIAEELGL